MFLEIYFIKLGTLVSLGSLISLVNLDQVKIISKKIVNSALKSKVSPNRVSAKNRFTARPKLQKSAK